MRYRAALRPEPEIFWLNEPKQALQPITINQSTNNQKAEEAGFEPAVQFEPYVGLANRWFQPLTHSSEWAANIERPVANDQLTTRDF